MDPLALRAAFRVALLITVVGVALLVFEPRGSAESVVSAMAVAVGLVFIAAVWVAARFASPRLPRGSASDDKARREAQSVAVHREHQR